MELFVLSKMLLVRSCDVKKKREENKKSIDVCFRREKQRGARILGEE